jgi:hypothetical protein
MRWDGDERGAGVADASAFAVPVEELLGAMRNERWVAEDPELHLLPHLRAACEALPFELTQATVADDGVFDVELTWSGDAAGVGAVRAGVIALVGSVAELSTFVRQHPDVSPTVLRFDAVTGFVGSDGRFEPHGHTLRISVRR